MSEHGTKSAKSESPDFPRDPEEARLDAELTRRELGETAQELVDRVRDVAQRMAFGAGAAFGFAFVVLFMMRKLARRRRRRRQLREMAKLTAPPKAAGRRSFRGRPHAPLP